MINPQFSGVQFSGLLDGIFAGRADESASPVHPPAVELVVDGFPTDPSVQQSQRIREALDSDDVRILSAADSDEFFRSSCLSDCLDSKQILGR